MTAPVTVHRGSLIAIFAAILFASFSYDLFRVVEREAYFTELTRHHYLGYDSYLVLDRLHLTEQGQANTLSPLTEKYRSQFGLQGVILGLVLKLTRISAVQLAYVASGAFSLLTALVLAAFFADIANRLGRVTAGIAVMLTAWSPQLCYMTPSLYWCMFLLVSPFVLTWLLEPWFSARRYGWVGRFGLLFLLVLAKCLCGYEYVTTIILSPLAALWFHSSGQIHPLRNFFVRSSLVVAAGVLAFGCAILLHAAQLQYVVGVNGFETIRERATSRTVGVQGQEGSLIPIRKSFRRLPERIAYPASCFVEYFEQPATVTTGYHAKMRKFIPVRYYFAFAGILGVATLLARRRMPETLRRLVGTLIVGAAASLSWHVLAINHMRVHFHLNGIIFFVPFLPICFVAIGQTVELAFQAIRVREWAVAIQMPALVTLVLCGAILEINQRAVRYADDSRARQAVSAALDRPAGEERSIWDYHIDGVRELNGFPAPELDFGSEMNRSRLVQDRGKRGKIAVISGWVAVPAGRKTNPLHLFAARDQNLLHADSRFYPRMDAARAVGPDWEARGFHLVVRLEEQEDAACVRAFAVFDEHVQEMALPKSSLASR